MKIRSQLLQTLVLTATSVATSIVLFSSSPAQAVNLIKNSNYGGTVNFPWEGNAYPNNNGGGFGTIFQILSEPTDPLRTYQISFEYSPFDILSLNVSIGSTTLANLERDNTFLNTFTKVFNGNGSDKLVFNYQLNTPVQSLFLSNLGVEDLSPPKDPTSPTPSVPEPLTIVGTIIGGTAAFRLKKRLESSKK
jgi:hypothetical protein